MLVASTRTPWVKYTLARQKNSDWLKSGPVKTGPTWPSATPLYSHVPSMALPIADHTARSMIGSWQDDIIHLHVCLSVCLTVTVSVTLSVLCVSLSSMALRVGVGCWKLHRRVPSTALPIHFCYFCGWMHRLATRHSDRLQSWQASTADFSLKLWICKYSCWQRPCQTTVCSYAVHLEQKIFYGWTTLFILRASRELLQ